MSKHTPGPWRASHDSHGRFQLIADGIPLDPERDGAQPGEGAANATLIAAAPDLLAALRHLTEVCVRNDDGSLTLGSEDVANLEREINKAGGAK